MPKSTELEATVGCRVSRRNRWRLLLVASVVTIAGSSTGLAAEISHSEYVERAEAVCKSGKEVSRPLLKAGKRELNENKVVLAGSHFSRAAKVFDSIGRRLKAIPLPDDEANQLKAWFKHLEAESVFLGKTASALRAGHRVQAQGYLARFVHSANVANDSVLGFGFRYCLLH